MNRVSKTFSLFLIFLPLLFAGFVRFAPESLSASTANHKALEFEKAGNWFSSAENLKTVLELSGWRADAWQKLGRASFELKEYEQSAEAFEQTRKSSELTFDNIARLGKSYLQLDRVGDAQNLWREISLTAPTDFDFLMETAANQREIGDTFGTITTLLAAYELQPTNLQVNYLLGIHLAATQPQSAVKFLEFSVKSTSPEKSVSESLLSEIENSSQDPGLRSVRIGQILSNAGEWDMAASSFDLAVQKDETNAFAWALLGEALQHTGKGGLDELQKALDLEPGSDIANALMALYYRRQNKPELALPYLYRAVKAAPGEATWQVELGNTLADTGDLKSALDHFIAATLADPKDPLTWQSLATFCFTRNVEITPTGLNAARKALELDPQNPQLLDLMGMGLLINGDTDSADRFFSQAITIDPKEASYHLHYGQLYIQEKDCVRAASELRQAISLAKDDRIKSNAERLLSDYCAGY